MPQTASADAPPAGSFGSDGGSSTRVFAAALTLALLLHGILLVFLRFQLPDSDIGKRTTRALDVVLLRHAAPTDEEPEIADTQAQVNREGAGTNERRDNNERTAVEARPEPPPPPSEPVPEPAEKPVPRPPTAPPITGEALPPPPEDEVTLSTAVVQPELEALPTPIKDPPEPETSLGLDEPAARPTVTAAQILASRGMEIAELTARIERSTDAYANRPRRKAISASTRAYKYANYLETWRRKVERIGNLNYPREAKRRKLYGNLILHVAVRADGSLESTRILRSSGFDLLDQAAIRIVELAAPFAPFPADIKAETDILDITRTWQFQSNNRLGWEK